MPLICPLFGHRAWLHVEVYDLNIAMVPPAGVAADLGHLESKVQVRGYARLAGRSCLGPVYVVPVSTVSFLGRFGSPTKIDCRKKGTLVLTSLLEDLVVGVSDD